MADFLIDAGSITTFADTQKGVSELNSTISKIVDKYNAAFNVTTGHSHDDVDSRSISSGASGLTQIELAIARMMGISLWG